MIVLNRFFSKGPIDSLMITYTVVMNVYILS